MLNKLGRKRMTITVGKRKPTLADEVDSMVVISVEKTDNPVYQVRMGKPRPEGVGEPLVWHGTISDLSEEVILPNQLRSLEEIIPVALRGCTKAIQNVDVSPYPEKSIYQTTPGDPDAGNRWSDLD